MENFIKTLSLRVSFIYSQYFLYFFSIAIPLIFSGPQIVTGTIVNAILFISAVKLSKIKTLPVIFLPSAATLMHGVIFGGFTPFLVLFLPFIWIGNSLIIFVFRNKSLLTGITTIFLASVLKAGLLYFVAVSYFAYHLVPKIFITFMGILQFETAILGGIAAIFILKASVKNE